MRRQLHRPHGSESRSGRRDILLSELHDEDAVLVIGADSALAPRLLAEAMRRLREGVGGVLSALQEHILASNRWENVEGTLRLAECVDSPPHCLVA